MNERVRGSFGVIIGMKFREKRRILVKEETDFIWTKKGMLLLRREETEAEKREREEGS